MSAPLYESGVKGAIKALLTDPRGLMGIVILSFFTVMAVAPWLFSKYTVEPLDRQAPEEYNKIINMLKQMNITGKPVPIPPIPGHPLGIDQAWRDIWARVVYGARISLLTGVLSAVIAMVIGVIVGSLAGYYGGKIDGVLMILSDTIMMLPGLLLLILITSLFRDIWNIWYTILLISLIAWPSTARAIRAQVMQLKAQGYVDAAKCLGARDRYIIVKHIWPQVLPFALARATILVAGAIVTVASLSFLLPETTQGADWGSVISDSYTYWSDVVNKGMWLWFFVPGVFIALVVIGFICIGEVLIDYLNPKLRRI